MPSLVGHLVERLAANNPGRAAIMSEDGRVLARLDLHIRSNRLANSLLAAGLRPGDRVAVWMEDVIECVETYVALAKASLVAVAVSKLLTPAEGAHVLSDVDARAVVCTAGTAERVAAAIELSTCQAQVLIGVGARPAGALGYGALGYEEMLAEGSERTPTVRQEQADQDVMIGYTSGTTGFPKGALIRESALGPILAMSAMARRLEPHGIGLATVSLSFPASLPAVIFSHFYAGATVCLVNGWDVDKVLSLVGRTGATFLSVPSPGLSDFIAAVAAHPERAGPLRTVMHGGSKAPPEQIRAMCEVTSGRFVEIWGMMENSGGPVTTTTPADYTSGEADDIYSSVGRPMPQCIVRCVGPDGTALPPGPDHVGELTFASPALFSRYWHNPAATAEVLADGWYRTGDLGWIDRAGFVYIVDRRQDLIVSGGMNVYPSELERVLAAHPAVAEVAVVGLPHQRWGRTPVAVVVVRPGATLSEPDLLNHCQRQLASYKKPSRILFIDQLPHNASGKIVRGLVEEWAAGQPDGP